MDFKKKERNENPKESASLLSKTFFLWVMKIIFRGKEVKEDEVPKPMKDDVSDTLGSRLHKRWMETLVQANAKGQRPSLIKAVLKEFGPRYLTLGLVFFLSDILSGLVRPFLLGKLLSHFSPSSTSSQVEGVLYALGLCSTFFFGSLLMEQYFVASQMSGVQLRVACISVVYRKCLRLGRNAFASTSAGQIVNLISNDVSRFEMAGVLVNCMIYTPLVAIILFYMVLTTTGIPGFVGFSFVLVIMAIQGYNGKLASKFRLQMAKRTDERVRLMDEIISGIQVIKMYAWEKPFESLICEARRREVSAYRKTAYLRATHHVFNIFTTRMALFLTMLTVVLLESQLTAEFVFVLSLYFTQLTFSLTGLFVRGFQEIAECYVSIKRLEEFLLQDEFGSKIDYATYRNPNLFKNKKSHDKMNGSANGAELYHHNYENGFINQAFEKEREDQTAYSVEMKNVNARWLPNSNDLTLKNINLKIKKGMMVGVIGTVGAGKSSLLQLLLGELETCQGEIKIKGTVSYSSQEAWIFAGSVRQNILFGQEYNKRRYNRVTKACSLERDFELLPRGDLTLVGERGASLSGGQKARINLARAVYKEVDIYLLDDPLSAVDAHVGKHLFQDCLEDFLHGKTIILVTHQIHHLTHADHLVLLNNNAIEMQGPFWELQNAGLDYSAFMETSESIKDGSEEVNFQKQISRSISYASTKSHSSNYGKDEFEQVNDFETTEREKEETTHLPTKELYLGYLKAGINYCGAFIILLMFAFTQVLASGCDYWVTYWTSIEISRQNQPDPKLWNSITFSVFHGIIVLILFISASIRGISFYEATINCTRGIHRKMFKSVIGTHLSFFHNNPSGRILNRFSKDLGSVDELLSKALMDVGQCFGMIIGALTITVMINQWFIIPIIIITIISGYVRQIFVHISKNLKRIEGVARSPVFSHLNATLQGLTTIRVNKAEKQLLEEFDQHQDYHTGSLFLFYSSTTAFSYALTCLSNSFITIVILSFLIFHNTGSNIGLTINQVVVIGIYLQWGIRMSAEITNQMTSCERLLEYTKFELEENNPDRKQKVPEKWPTHGQLEMKHVYLRYSKSEPYVIKDLSLTIQPKQKVSKTFYRNIICTFQVKYS
uniref:ABC transmembrane type-1 domain-containing protein n=2 Tax=Clastoptera arizonana TaxID=38151 RepID=A0A1B6DDY1_9HEMI